MEQISQSQWIIAIVLIIIAFILIGYSLFSSRKKQDSARDSTEYIKALNAFIEGNLDDAIQLFYQAVRKNTENIDAYVRLGDLFRKKGRLEKATMVHRELLVRQNLSPESKTQIKKSLVLDYVEAGKHDKALEILNQLSASEPKNTWVKRQQVRAYEAKSDWDNAFKHQKALSRLLDNEKKSDKLALYKVESANIKFDESREKDGRILLREAIKIDSTSAPAYIFLGDSYVREQRYEDAIKIWVEFVSKVPDKSHLVFDRLQEVLYTIGSYSEIETILEDIHQRVPQNVEVSITLLDIRARKGDLQGAIEICERIFDTHPQSHFIRLRLVKLYARAGDSKKALKTALELADRSTLHDSKHICVNCQYESQTPLWHCPECGSWSSFESRHDHQGIKV